MVVSGFSALSLLTALVALINAAQIRYAPLALDRVHLQLLSDRGDMVLWAASLVLLAVVLAVWRRFDWHTIGLAAVASLVLTLANVVSWLPEDVMILAGAILTVLLLARLAVSDRNYLRSTWFCLAGLLIFIELLAFVHWLVFPYNKSLADSAAAFEMGLAFSGYPLILPLLILLLLSWIPLWLPAATIRKILQRSLRAWSSAVGLVGSSRKLMWVLCFLALGISVLIGFFPYLRIRTRLVGGDIDCCYMPMLLDVLRNGPGVLGSSDRLFLYSILYAAHVMSGASAFVLLMLLPIALTVMTAVATFVMVRLGLGDSIAAITAAIVSALSFNTTAAIFMDLYANWFANAILLLTMGLILYAFRGGRHVRLAAGLAVAASVLVLFSHALVWWSMMAIMIIFGVPSVLFAGGGRKRRLGLLITFLAANVLAYQARLTLGTSGTMLDGSVVTSNYSSLAWGLVDGSVYGPFWFNLNHFMFQTGVFYANWLLVILATAGVLLLGLGIRGSDRDFRWLLGAWMLVGAVLTVTLSNVLNPYYSATTFMPLVWRGLFMIPIQIPAAIALSSLLCSRSGRFAYVLFMLALLNYALRTLALTIIG
jgi:hypothetical protein